jgi:hypothetical protein
MFTVAVVLISGWILASVIGTLAYFAGQSENPLA